MDFRSFLIPYFNDAARLQLIRCYIARFLFKHVLDPFIFGLAPQSSRTLREISTDIMGNGTHLLVSVIYRSCVTIYKTTTHSPGSRRECNMVRCEGCRVNEGQFAGMLVQTTFSSPTICSTGRNQQDS